jgi:hypothetical protein
MGVASIVSRGLFPKIAVTDPELSAVQFVEGLVAVTDPSQ